MEYNKINKNQNSSQNKKMVRITPPTLTKGKHRCFLYANDGNGNQTLMMVQGKLTDEIAEQVQKITDKRFITLAQRFLDEMKNEM